MTLKRFFILTLLACSVFLTACYKELNNLEFGTIEWSPELALPLINSTVTFAELLEEADTTIKYEEQNETMVLIFEDDSLFSSRGTDYYSLANKSFPDLPIMLTPEEINTFNTTGSVLINRSAQLEYTNSLDSILINSGRAELELEEDFPADGNISLSLSTGDNSANGNLLSYSYGWSFDGTNQVTSDNVSNTFNNITFRFIGPRANNLLRLDYQLQLNKVNNRDLVLNESRLSLSFDFKRFDYEALFGDLGTQNISTERNTIETDFFNSISDFSDVNYFFNDPQFTINYTNSLGVPIEFRVDEFSYFSEGNSQSINYNEVISVPQAELNEPALTSVSFDEQIKEVVNNKPDSIRLSINGTLDPNNTPDNFLKANSSIQVGYQLAIPLELSISNLVIDENVSIDGGIEPGNTKYALFRITTVNEIPLDVDLEILAFNSDSTLLETIFDGLLLEGAKGEAATNHTETIQLEDDPNTTANELSFLNETSYLKIKGTLASTNNGNDVVNISSNAELSVNVSVQTQYTIELN